MGFAFPAEPCCPGKVIGVFLTRRRHVDFGRSVRFGIRLHVITRDTSEQAWAHAESLLAVIDPATIERVQAGLARSESEGQRRMRALHGGSTADLEVAPNLWAGVGLVRGGAGTALVGGHTEVADRIAEYHALGIDEFVLSGHPHLEEAWWMGEGVLTLLRQRGLWQPLVGQELAPGSAGRAVRGGSPVTTLVEERPGAPATGTRTVLAASLIGTTVDTGDGKPA